jgi:hypothetical protein
MALSDKQKHDIADQEQAILTFLEGAPGPMTALQIREATNLDRPTMRRRLESMANRGLIKAQDGVYRVAAKPPAYRTNPDPLAPDEIRVLVKQSAHEPLQPRTILATLEAAQGIVGGDIEAVALPLHLRTAGIMALVNERGALEGLPMNVPPYRGPMLFHGVDSGGNTLGLTDEQIVLVKSWLGA